MHIPKHTRPIIGHAYGVGTVHRRTPRTMEEAFGPGARLRSRPVPLVGEYRPLTTGAERLLAPSVDRADRIVLIVGTVLVAMAFALAAWEEYPTIRAVFTPATATAQCR